MKTFVPDYYTKFKCIAGKCRHTCCVGWEIDVDEDSLPRFLGDSFIAPHIDRGETPQIRLLEGERCPFLREDGLCDMILLRGEDSLCQICRDHPRFRNYFSDRTEVGIGLVCEEAARIILSSENPMSFVLTDDDGGDEELSEDEEELLALREKMLAECARTESGPSARLLEYLIFRHLADSLDDGMQAERIRFIFDAKHEVEALWAETDGSIEALVEAVRVWSYDTEYDDEVIGRRLAEYGRS